MRIRVSGSEREDEGWARSDTVQPPAEEQAGTPNVPARRARQYLISLPERVLRSATGFSAGLLRELGDVGLPKGVRQSKLYGTMVEATLRFLIEQVGQVEGAYPPEGRLSEDFAFRRTAGNGIELAGILAFRASPVWVMAALADISGSGRRLIREISESLKQEGLLEKDRQFESVDQLLDGLERSSGRLADTINSPPLDVASLRREWDELRGDLRRISPSKLPSANYLRTQWEDLRSVAVREERSIFQLSSVMALAAVQRLPEDLRWLSRSSKVAARHTGQLLAGALLDHYRETLGEIRRTGFVAYWRRQFRPYLKAAALQFSPERVTLLERALARRHRSKR